MSHKKLYDFITTFRWNLTEIGKELDLPPDLIDRLEGDLYLVLLAIDTYMMNLQKGKRGR